MHPLNDLFDLCCIIQVPKLLGMSDGDANLMAYHLRGRSKKFTIYYPQFALKNAYLNLFRSIFVNISIFI